MSPTGQDRRGQEKKAISPSYLSSLPSTLRERRATNRDGFARRFELDQLPPELIADVIEAVERRRRNDRLIVEAVDGVTP